MTTINDFLHVESINDLNHALTRQRAITRQVLVEFDELSARILPETFEGKEPVEVQTIWGNYRQAERRLFAHYANLPTLTEFERVPGLRGMEREGGTFGVAALIGETILTMMSAIDRHLAAIHRYIVLLLLSEMDRPAHERQNMIDLVLRVMPKESSPDLVRELIAPTLEAVVAATGEYGLIDWNEDGDYFLTTLGRRTLLHMIDSERFIDTIAAAHKRLQGIDPAKVTK